MRRLATALLIIALLITGGVAVPGAQASSCTSSSYKNPPSTIMVFRSHERGSSVPARVEKWDFRRYVAAVMSSGAWPGTPRESAKVGAIAIHNYALWMMVHHQPGHYWHGQCYSISDGEQYLRRDVRPWTHVPDRTIDAVRIVWGIVLKKNGHYFRTGWSGGGQYDRWHLGEDAVRAAAQRGWGWRTIIHTFLSPVEIVGDWK